MNEYLGTLLSSDTDYFPLHRPANLPATQSTPNSPKNLVKTLCPKLRNKSDVPPLNLHQSFAAQLPASSVNIFPRPPSPFSSHPSSGLPPVQIISNTASRRTQPQISTFEPQVPLKPTQFTPSLFVLSNHPKIPITRPRPSIPNSLATFIGQPMPMSSLSNPPKPIPINPLPQNWTIPSPDTLPSPFITQFATFLPLFLRYQNLNQFLNHILSIFHRVVRFRVK